MRELIQSVATVAVCALPCVAHYWLIHKPRIRKIQADHDEWLRRFDYKSNKRL